MDQTYCPYCMTPVRPGEPCPVCGLTEGSYHPQPHHLPPGTLLADRYLLGRVLGEGGFGITYIGCDTRLELRVAVKEYFPGNHVARNCASSLAVTCYDGVAGRGFEKGRERFIREARTMAKMDKTPQIVGVRDFFQANNTAYIVMEYVDGTTFKELVTQKGGGMSADELLPMVEPLFGALETMHQQGLIHRDISPDNLMLENGMVRLLDFGCARESEKGNETMTIVLKQGYSPVEQYQHKGQGPWTDVYSLAATMYYCLTGKTPPQALDRICDDELIPPRKLGADLTREQERALLFGMGLQPTRRFRSAREFYAALYQGAPVPLSPRDRESPPDTREEESVPENGAQTPPESGTEIPLSQEPAVEPAGEPPGETVPQEPKTVQSVEWTEPEAAQPVETDEPAGETAVKPDRKKLFLIGGAVAAAALIAALIFAIPKLIGPADPSADGSQPPEGSIEQLPDGLFDGAVEVNSSGEENILALLADDSVSSIVIPEGRTVSISSAAAVEIAKPMRLMSGAHLLVSGPLTVSSVVELTQFAWLDQNAGFTLTGSGALYIGSGSYVHVSNSGTGSDDIAGSVRIGEGSDFGVGGEAVSLSGTVLANGGCNINGKAAVSGTIQVTGSGDVSFNGETDITGTVQVAEGGGASFNEETDITGTVQVAEGGGAFFGGFTTVSGEGRISVDGYANCGHVLKTVDGGGVTVGDTGRMDFNVLWLEKNTDLSAAGDHIGMDQARYIVADEDVFDNAAHVNSFRELEQAVNDRLVSAIVIDSSFEMEYGLSINKPVLISEGAELRANENSQSPGFSGGVIVNYGCVTGFMNLEGQCVYLNYGATDVAVWANGGENCLLNMGELNLQHGQFANATIINLGRMRHETYGGEDANFLDLVGTVVENLGEFTLRSGNRMSVYTGYFENNGELLIEENARLENNSCISANSQLRVRGTLDNSAGVLDIPDPSRLSMEGGRVEGGIIQAGGAGYSLENNENITCQVLTKWDEPSYTTEVSNADELLEMLDRDTQFRAIRVTGDITIDGDLGLRGRDLIIDNGASLRAGNLIVTGQAVYVYGKLEANEVTIRNSGQLQLHGGAIDTGALTLKDSTCVIWGGLTAGSANLNNARLINWGNIHQCGKLTVDGDSYFHNSGNLELTEGAIITVNQGTFVGHTWLEMNSGEITVREGGTMRLRGGANLGGNVAITNEGDFEAVNNHYNIGAILINFGRMDIIGWEWQDIHLHGLFVNRQGGYLRLGGAPNFNKLDNEGELEISYGVLQIHGELNNNGRAYTYNREAGWQGNWTGRALEYR